MAIKQVEQERQRRLGRYFLIGTGILLSALFVGAIVFFWEELQHATSYGYVSGFIASILTGVTIIPFPSLLVIFTLGHVLNPLYLGLVAGLGGAIGETTVYLTGAGGGTLWSKLRARQRAFYHQPVPAPAQPKPRSKWQAFYQRLSSSVGRRGGLWAVFITSAFLWPLSYPVDLAAGTLRIGLKRFFLVCWAGRTIRGFIVAYAGHWGLHFLLQWLGG